MKRLFLMVAIACLSLTACEQALDVGDDGNSNDSSNNGSNNGSNNSSNNGSNNGGGGDTALFTVNSGAFAVIEVDASDASKTWHATEVYATNHANICENFNNTCEDPEDLAAGTKVLRITLFATDEHKTGTYTIGDFDEEDTPSDALVAKVDFMDIGSDSQLNRQPATAGYLEVDAYDAQTLSGTYELTIQDDVTGGSFSINHCPSLQAYRDNC